MAERAQELLAERRVWLTNETDDASVALVGGRHALYTVVATRAGLRCNCKAGRRCSHITSAMAAWAERDDRSDREAEREAREYHDPDVDRDPLEAIYEPSGWPE